MLNRVAKANNLSSDCFGFGVLDYLTIETDGSYHTTYILKVAYDQASAIGMTMSNFTILEALSSPAVLRYNRLLKEESLSAKCLKCSVKEICGGGSMPHRFSKNGFNNPTVYCNEMYALITHCKTKILSKMLDYIDHNK